MTTGMKAFLCSQDGSHNFPIVQKVTTIGRENCDIIICVSFSHSCICKYYLKSFIGILFKE